MLQRVSPGVVFFLLVFLGVSLFGVGYLIGISSLHVFIALFVCVAIANFPRYFISPVSVVLGYYFAWFVIAPSFAELHLNDDFTQGIFYLAYLLCFLVLVTACFGARLGELKEQTKNFSTFIKFSASGFDKRNIPSNTLIYSLYAVATALVVSIVLSSGGFSYWIEAPGEAFLNRAGSGVYVVLSHLTIFCLAGLVGFKAYITRRKIYLFQFLFWLVITSPVHGSKGLMALFLILACMPWLRFQTVLTLRSYLFFTVLIFIFFFGLYLRNISWITLDEALPYALNYFTTFRNLVMLLQDYQPGFLETFFLPFNKLLTPFGLTDQSLYYDMNHLLTDKYFPTAWEIRATEQWPVEADLYLNFYFFFGLPLIFIYMYIVGFIYGLAHRRNNLGAWVLSFLLIVSIVSHLRGSLYNHIDFYLIPMFFIIFFSLRNYLFVDDLKSNSFMLKISKRSIKWKLF